MPAASQSIASFQGGARTGASASKIQHVIIMIQENRSFNDFFATYPGATGATSGYYLQPEGKTFKKTAIALTEGNLVAPDFNHDSHSSIFALNETKVIDGNFVRVMSWYDNEWGFSCRMSDTAAKMAALG